MPVATCLERPRGPSQRHHLERHLRFCGWTPRLMRPRWSPPGGAGPRPVCRNPPLSPRAFQDKSEVNTRSFSVLIKADTRGSLRVPSLSRVQMCAAGALRLCPNFVFQVGLLDLELNQLTKALFLALVALSVVMVTLQGFVGPWYRNLFRFLLLFSYIIPIR